MQIRRFGHDLNDIENFVEFFQELSGIFGGQSRICRLERPAEMAAADELLAVISFPGLKEP